MDRFYVIHLIVACTLLLLVAFAGCYFSLPLLNLKADTSGLRFHVEDAVIFDSTGPNSTATPIIPRSENETRFDVSR